MRACLLPSLFAVGDLAEPCEREHDVPFVADRGGDLGRLGEHGGSLVCLSLLERHLGKVAEREGDPGEIPDPATQLQALLEVSGRPLVLSEHRHHPTEVVQRHREHEVVACRARESDRFLAHGHCRPTIGRATGGLGPDGAEDGGGDRGRRGGSGLLRAGEARLEQGERLLVLVLLGRRGSRRRRAAWRGPPTVRPRRRRALAETSGGPL